MSWYNGLLPDIGNTYDTTLQQAGQIIGQGGALKIGNFELGSGYTNPLVAAANKPTSSVNVGNQTTTTAYQGFGAVLSNPIVWVMVGIILLFAVLKK